jgi:hypothetical protein
MEEGEARQQAAKIYGCELHEIEVLVDQRAIDPVKIGCKRVSDGLGFLPHGIGDSFDEAVQHLKYRMDRRKRREWHRRKFSSSTAKKA